MATLNYAPGSHRHHLSPIAIVAAMGSLFVLIWVATGSVNQITAAVMFGVIGVGLAALQPTVAIVIALIYVSLLGDLRRYIVVQAGVTSNDPLLLVGPAIAVACVVMGLVKRRFVVRTLTSKLILGLMALMVLEMLNPLQGGITVGVAGGLFFLVPLLWFWVGQAWGSAEFLDRLLFRVFVPLAVLGSILGLAQGMYGYLHYEALWFRMTTESAARPDMRPFAFFSSWAEYAFYTAAALVVVLTPLTVRRVRFATLFAPLFMVALVIQSVREAIAGTVIALCVIWAVQARSVAAIGSRMVMAVIVAAVVMGLGLSTLREADVASDAVKQNLTHTADGFLDVQNSSAGGHVDLMVRGMIYGVTNPIGLGLGGPTLAGAKAGAGLASEIDISDLCIACGIGGALLYACILFAIVRSAIIDWRDHHRMIALYVLGIMISQPGHILAGGHYAMSVIIWFTIGTFDRVCALDPIAGAMPVIRRPARRAPFRPSLATGNR